MSDHEIGTVGSDKCRAAIRSSLDDSYDNYQHLAGVSADSLYLPMELPRDIVPDIVQIKSQVDVR